MDKNDKILLAIGLGVIAFYLLSRKSKSGQLLNTTSNNSNSPSISNQITSASVTNPINFNQLISSASSNPTISSQFSTQVTSGTSNVKIPTKEEKDCYYMWLSSAKPRVIMTPEQWAQREKSFIENCMAKKKINK